MPDNPQQSKIDRIKTVKSAYILKARDLADRGHVPEAMAWYLKAADMEFNLAELLRSIGDTTAARINLFSAASCLYQARQYRRASEIFLQLQEEFPDEVPELIAQCEGKQDMPLPPGEPDLQTLVNLLMEKKVFTPSEWSGAIVDSQ